MSSYSPHLENTQAYDFLSALYAEAPGYVNICVPDAENNWHSNWFPTSDLAGAAQRAVTLARERNVYFGVGLHRVPPPTGRGKGDGVIAIPGLWLDLDIAGPTHKKTSLPTTTQEAGQLLEDFPLEPSLIVYTGGGLHVYWLFQEPWEFKTPQERREAESVSRRFQTTMARKATQRGWKDLDTTADLARVLRVVGTLNRKPELGEPCLVKQFALFQDLRGHRYKLEDFEQFLTEDTPKGAAGQYQKTPTVEGRIPEGKRNSTLASLGGTLRQRAMTEGEIAAFLAVVNEGRCDPPLPDEEVRKIAASIARYAPGELNSPTVTIGGKTRGEPQEPPATITASALMRKQLAPMRMVVPGLLYEGANIVAGSPKVGKSWLMLDIALAVAGGWPALATQRVEQGDVLYLALEDGIRRVRARLDILLGETEAPDALEFAYHWPPLDKGGAEAIENWLNTHPRARLVVVDTLKRIRPRVRANSPMYDADYDAVSPLSDLALSRGITVAMTMHTRKAEADDPLDLINGTLGLSGAADAALVLKRARMNTEGTLAIVTRDGDDKELALKWDAPRWQLAGDATEYKLTVERRAILETIRAGGEPVTPKVLADRMGKKHSTMKQLLWKMSQAGVLTVDHEGHYSIP